MLFKSHEALKASLIQDKQLVHLMRIYFPPHISHLKWSNSVWLPQGHTHYVEMDATRTRIGTDGRFPITRSCLPVERRVLSTLPLLFLLVYFYINMCTGVSKESNNACEEVQILQGISDTVTFAGQIFSYPVPAFAFKGKITQYKVKLLLKTLLSAIYHRVGGYAPYISAAISQLWYHCGAHPWREIFNKPILKSNLLLLGFVLKMKKNPKHF